MLRTALMNVMTAAAQKTARGLKRDFGEVENLQVSIKGPGEFVTAADRKAEKTLFEELSRARPGYGFLMEEGGAIEGSDKSHRWIIDPLDGTTNFLHGLPFFAISIALEREGQLVAGLVYNPISDDMFVAERGQGAYHNNRRLRVSQRQDLVSALVGCGVPHHGKAATHPQFRAELAAVMSKVLNIRRFGAAALDLAFIAAGRLDAYWERDLSPWDLAAGVILVREAGGFITDSDGGPEILEAGSVCAGNETMHRQMLAILKSARIAAA